MSLIKLKHNRPIKNQNHALSHFHFTQSFHHICNTINYCERFHDSTWCRLEKQLPS